MQIPIHYMQTLFCMNNPDPTDHCQAPEIIGIKMSNRCQLNDVSEPKCQHPDAHGQTLFLIIKEQQGQALLHEWEEQGLRIKDSSTGPECGVQVWVDNKVTQESSDHPVSAQWWGWSTAKLESSISGSAEGI